MDKNRTIVFMVLVLFSIFSTAGSAFAGADISVSFDKKTANVGDQVRLLVFITNTGLDDLTDVKVSVPIPAGLKYMTSETGATKNIYNASTGVWQVDNLKLSSKDGGKKTLNITLEVEPEFAGKTIIANTSYISVNGSSGALPLKSAQTEPLKISNSGNGTSNPTTTTTNTPWGTYAVIGFVIVVILVVGVYLVKRNK